MVEDSSTKSNSVGKAVHRLTHLRHPWQMSKMRSSSFSALAWSQNSGFFQSSGCRVGASSDPSLIYVSIRKRVQGLLEAVGVAALGLGQGLEPVGDLAEVLVARLLR